MLRPMSETPPNRRNEYNEDNEDSILSPPPDWHFSADLFRRFLDQRASRPERKAILRHLLAQCPACTDLARRITTEAGYWLGAEGAKAFADLDYDAAFRAAVRFADRAERRIAFEHLRGCAHWSALIPLPPDERLPLIVLRRDWHYWGLFRVLLDAAGRASRTDPNEAASIARLALDIVGLLDPQAVGGDAAANDMQSRAWAVIADCRRFAADLQHADAVDIFRQVQHALRAGDQREFLLATLDLAEAHTVLGETATAVRLLAAAALQPAIPIPHRNATAAWHLLHRELAGRMEMGVPAGALFSRLRLYYRRNWHVPSAVFSIGGG